MTKEELLKAIEDNMGLFDEAEQGVLNDVLDYNKKGAGKDDKGKPEDKPDGDEKKPEEEEKPEEEGKEPGDGKQPDGSEPEDEKEGKPDEPPEDDSKQEQPKPEEQPNQPQAMADPRVDALLQQMAPLMAKIASLEDAVSKIVVVKPAEEQPASGYGASAKGNPANVQNTSATDSLVASMGGYGR